MKKALRQMGRRDLLRLLLEVQQENEALRQEVETLRAEAEKKRIDLEQLGSIAEAALVLNRVFEDAQRAADQYVANARAIYAPQEDDPAADSTEEEQTDGEA